MKDLTDYLSAYIADLRTRLADALDPGRFGNLKRREQRALRRERRANAELWQYRDAIDRINQKARMGSLPGQTVVQVDRFEGGIERETALTASAVRHVDLGVTVEFQPGRLSVHRGGEVLFAHAAGQPGSIRHASVN